MIKANIQNSSSLLTTNSLFTTPTTLASASLCTACRLDMDVTSAAHASDWVHVHILRHCLSLGQLRILDTQPYSHRLAYSAPFPSQALPKRQGQQPLQPTRTADPHLISSVSGMRAEGVWGAKVNVCRISTFLSSGVISVFFTKPTILNYTKKVFNSSSKYITDAQLSVIIMWNLCSDMTAANFVLFKMSTHSRCQLTKSTCSWGNTNFATILFWI